jgi:hypothetical protein
MTITAAIAELVTAQAVAEADRLYPGGPWCPPGQFLAWTAEKKYYLPLVREVEHAARIFFPTRRVHVSVQWLRRIVSSTSGGWQGAHHDEWIMPCLTTPGSAAWIRATNVNVSQSVLDALARIGCVEGVGAGHLFTAADLLLNGPRPALSMSPAEYLQSSVYYDYTYRGPGIRFSLPAFTWQRYLIDDAMRRFRGLGGTTLPPWTDRPALEDVRGLLLGASLGQFIANLPTPMLGSTTPIADWIEANLVLASIAPPTRPTDAQLRTLACGMTLGIPLSEDMPAASAWPEPLASVPALSNAIWSHLQAALDTANPPVSYPRRVPPAPGLGAYPPPPPGPPPAPPDDRPGDYAARLQHQANPGTADNGKLRLAGYKSNCAVTFPRAHFRQLPEDLPTEVVDPPKVRSMFNQLVILHVAVAQTLGVIENTWKGPKEDGTPNKDESHFGVGEDGTVWQWVDLKHQANANVHADARAISIETTNDTIPGGNNNDGLIPEWSVNQIDSLRRLVAWSCLRYDIPTTIPAGAGPAATGIALHVFGARQNNLVNWRTWLQLGAADPPWTLHPQGPLLEPDEVWSGVLAKTCPGPVRTYQFFTSTGGRLLRLMNPAANVNQNRAVVLVPNPMPDAGLASLIQADVAARVLHDWPEPPT